MIDPASAFCIGVYFLGVGVVGSVLYIPVSLMRAIEHYRLRGDRSKSRGDDSLDGDLLPSLYGYSSTVNSYDRLARRSNSNHQSICDDGSSLFFERPELLLIHKKKVLRNILNDNNYLSNLIDFDEKSENSFGVCERFKTCQDSVHGGILVNRSKSEFGSSRKCLKNYPSSSIHNQAGGVDAELDRDILSTTTPSDKDENDEQPEGSAYNEGALFSSKFDERRVSGGRNAYACSSTNSTSSVVSCDTESSRGVDLSTNREYVNNNQNRLNRYFGSNISRSVSGRELGLRRGTPSSASQGNGNAIEVKRLMIVDEISAAHDILTL